MKILVLRHGIAKDRQKWAQTYNDDDARPLTSLGREKLNHVIDWLDKKAPPPDLVITSPLIRTQQTAQMVVAHFKCSLQQACCLRPEAHPSELFTWINDLKEKPSVLLVVGHEPHLSQWMSFALTEKQASFMELKKAGVSLLEFSRAIQPGHALLKWLIPPRLI